MEIANHCWYLFLGVPEREAAAVTARNVSVDAHLFIHVRYEVANHSKATNWVVQSSSVRNIHLRSAVEYEEVEPEVGKLLLIVNGLRIKPVLIDHTSVHLRNHAIIRTEAVITHSVYLQFLLE